MTQDYYKVLELEKTADLKQIKNMYYKKCYEYHPDRTGGMHQDKFKEINSAYEVLGKAETRNRYDQARKDYLNEKKSGPKTGTNQS